jgi:hypothetical protein
MYLEAESSLCKSLYSTLNSIYVNCFDLLFISSSVEGERTPEVFSGLYVYHIPTSTWTLLHEDCPEMRSRIGHSMLFHTSKRCLYIFAGQRSREYLCDLIAYHVDTDRIETISNGSKKDGSAVPAAGFTQRATIDSDLDEIHVLSVCRLYSNFTF